MTGESDVEALGLALAGGHSALPALVDRWTPIIQARVVRVLRRRAAVAEARAFQEVEGFVQQVFVSLFEKRSAALRAWQPERGMSLDNWVGLLAEQQVLSLVRTQKRNPWTEEPVVAEELDSTSEAPDPEHVTLHRDTLDRLLDLLQERLSPLGWQIFCLLFIDDAGVEATARQSGLTTTAVYAWRSRIRRLARELREILLSESKPPPHKPDHEWPKKVKS